MNTRAIKFQKQGWIPKKKGTYHTVAVFMHGFKFDFNNISGLLSLIVMLPVPISGLFRYQRMDRKWHLRSGVAFAILFLIHSFL